MRRTKFGSIVFTHVESSAGSKMNKVTIENLIEEAESASGIGKAWVQVVESAVRKKVRSRPPQDYGFREWDQATLQDVVQEVFERRILSQGGMEYVLAEATSTDHAHAAIYRLVGLALSDMREPNVLNNIFDNLNRRFSAIGIDLNGVQPGGELSGLVINEEAAEITAKNIFLSQPRYPNRGAHRESAVFGPDAFEEIVNRLKSEVIPLNSRVLRAGLKRALTHLVRAENYIDDSHDFQEGKVEGKSVEEEAISDAHEVALKVLKRLSPNSEKVFVVVAYGISSDTELARALGLKSRQTAKKWHDTMKLELSRAFEEFEILREGRSDTVSAMCDLLRINGNWSAGVDN